jgi:nitrous oxide reductase accessory protein NosL
VRLTALTIALLASVSCRSSAAGGPPEILIDRTACSHCGMLISELAYAAAYQVRGSEARVFDDIGCLVKAAPKEPRTDVRFWFHDVSSLEWIAGERTAAFVASADIRTPMGGGILAYRDLAAARQAAGARRGEIMPSLSDLLTRKGDPQ